MANTTPNLINVHVPLVSANNVIFTKNPGTKKLNTDRARGVSGSQ